VLELFFRSACVCVCEWRLKSVYRKVVSHCVLVCCVVVLKLLLVYNARIWGFVFLNVLFVLFIFLGRMVMLQLIIRDTNIYHRWNRPASFPDFSSFN